MKRFFYTLLVLVLIFSLAACGAAPAADKFVFKHGYDKDYPPYSFIQEDGTDGGFDVELAKAVCEKLGWEYQGVPFNWDAKDLELNSGACDCIWSGFTINGREDDYLWTKPYSDNTQKVLVPKDSEIKTLADLAGKQVAVQGATSAYDMLTKAEEGELKDLKDSFAGLSTYETYTAAIADMNAGAIDAVVIDVTQGNFQISKNPDLVFLDEDLATEQYGIGFRLGDTELRDSVEKAIAELKKDGTFEAIGKKYPDIYDYLIMEP
jgi:polar amino acid transport system substrate-binding protein